MKIKKQINYVFNQRHDPNLHTEMSMFSYDVNRPLQMTSMLVGCTKEAEL